MDWRSSVLDRRWKMVDGGLVTRHFPNWFGSSAGVFILVAFGMSNNYCHGPRWMGFWDNPNIYGMLMGAGTTLAIALQVLSLKSKVQSPKSELKRKITIIFLSVAIFMLGVGLIMSYSRGAWLTAAIGLLYLTWCYGRLKWR